MSPETAKPAKQSRAEQNAELRAKAARQAAKNLTAPEPDTIVTCTVLHKGDGKISTGQHVAGIGEVHYEKGETFSAPLPAAEELRERGYVDF
jgi:pyrimidine deaminase RibD-like protein